MAEAFSNKLVRAIGIVTTITGGSIGVTSTRITGISTAGIGVSDIVVNQNFIAGTKVTEVGITSVVVDRASTNSAAASSQNFDFMGLTTAYTSASGSVGVQIASKIPVPAGSSFVISDTGKTVLEGLDELRIYCDTANAIDATLSILTGVS